MGNQDRDFQAVVFDLDGTLLDTLQDIAVSANATLVELGEPELDLQTYRGLVGEGVVSLLRRALGVGRLDSDELTRAVARLEYHYGLNWNRHTRPYAGIPGLLDALVARQLPLAVLSNKPHEFTTLCVEQLLPDWRFQVVLGAREGLPRKPDPTGLHQVLGQLQVQADRVLYLGDTAIDMQTAAAAGCFPVGVSWGFRSDDELRAGGARRLISIPDQLLEML
jgi:phosphoglycolate phosphatase